MHYTMATQYTPELIIGPRQHVVEYLQSSSLRLASQQHDSSPVKMSTQKYVYDMYIYIAYIVQLSDRVKDLYQISIVPPVQLIQAGSLRCHLSNIFLITNFLCTMTHKNTILRNMLDTLTHTHVTMNAIMWYFILEVRICYLHYYVLAFYTQ